MKVLDFGLAKALEPRRSRAAARHRIRRRSPRPRRRRRVILGTAAYMAPDRRAGKAVDRRADIWAFGVVLYEMLTGRRLFAGETCRGRALQRAEARTGLEAFRRLSPHSAVYYAVSAEGSETAQRHIRRCAPRARRSVRHQRAWRSRPHLVLPRPLWRRALPVRGRHRDRGPHGRRRLALHARRPRRRWRSGASAFTLPDGEQLSSIGVQVVAFLRETARRFVYSANQRLYRRLLSELDAQAHPQEPIPVAASPTVPALWPVRGLLLGARECVQEDLR